MSPQRSFKLRPFLPQDAPLLAEIFRASIAELTGEDYDPAQQQAWASAADDEDAFARRLAERLTLVATLSGAPVGFACLREPDEIDMLYIHPVAVGQGAAAMLVEAVEKLAAARGARRLSVDASDTARGFFERRGYRAERRNSVACGGEWLTTTTMTKPLGPPRMPQD
jgi:putative acetyltransferase